MQITFSGDTSLWKSDVMARPMVRVLKRSVAMAGMVEIARAMARKAAREDHAKALRPNEG